MREILFRGMWVDNGEWVEGAYMKHKKRTQCPMRDRVRPGDIEHLILFSGFSDWNMPKPIECVPVDPTTVGQYIGLTGKNGVQIFEGDIAQYDDELVVVEWDDYDAMFYARSLDGTNWVTNFSEISGRNLVVIGNIHDNPELLEANHE